VNTCNRIVLYQPSFLGWCKSYKEEVEEMRKLILSNPGDIQMLKKEYRELTGKQFRGRKNE
jgi:hypothetical protein